ncbi:MAG: Gfo/Idh/MocA family oxidoreductase [Pseudomonadota bacterium]|nr:Gfo/Idh/MocA family oxidoreductase [Pseudomonadota bacterium]
MGIARAQSIGWGILGTGNIARQFATGLRDITDAHLQAVGSRDARSAQKFGDDFGAKRWHGSNAALAADDRVDVIYVATPHVFHAEHARLCLEAGKSVLCEKPFTMNAAEARALIDLARQRGRFLMEAMWTRFLPAMVAARRIATSGELGHLTHAHAAFGFASTFGSTHRLHDAALGGGALLDVGIYPLSFAASMLGPIHAATGYAQFSAGGVDDQTAFITQHADGGLGSGFCSVRSSTPLTASVCGTTARIEIDAPFYKPERLRVIDNRGSTRELHLPHLGNGYAHQAIEVARCLRAGELESAIMPLDETFALMQSLDQIRHQIGLRYPSDSGE